MDPPMPPLTFRRPLRFGLTLRSQPLGTTITLLVTTRLVTTVLPSARATVVESVVTPGAFEGPLCAKAGAANPMAAPTKAAMIDLFSNVISVPLLAGDRAPAFDNAPAGVYPALGTI
jgi:hypothetical protein